MKRETRSSSASMTTAGLALTGLLCLAPTIAHAQWTLQDSGTRSRLRAVSAVNDRVAWATGAGGTVLLTTDSGTTWQKRPVPEADDLDFRDVHAIDQRTAYILSIGPGRLSRIDRTTDQGATWTPSFRNQDPRVFLDAIAFWDEANGLAQGDPVHGRFVILTTSDAGKRWESSPDLGMPPALESEGAFAASGTCLTADHRRDAWFGTGGGKRSRVFHTTDRGRTWTVADTPITARVPSAGIFSLAFRDTLHGVAVGGDYRLPDQGGTIVARTEDGGATWLAPVAPGPRAFRSAVAYIPVAGARALIAVGPSGADASLDDGETWKPLSDVGYHAISLSGPHAGWAVGEAGHIGRFLGLTEPR